jgi:hypothetical protein
VAAGGRAMRDSRCQLFSLAGWEHADPTASDGSDADRSGHAASNPPPALK